MSKGENKSPSGAFGYIISIVILLLLYGLYSFGSSCIKYGRQPIECSPATGVCVYPVGSQYCPIEKGLLGYETISTSANSPSSTVTESSDGNSCSKEWVTSYLEDLDNTMKKASKLTNDFGQTQTREQATSIAKEVDDLYMEVSLWEVPECAKEVQVNLMLVIANISTMQQDILKNNMDAFNRDYKTYEIAVTQLNAEVSKLSKSIK
jgi:hypothetical protein